MMIDWAPLISAFVMGLLGSTHCLGMCGGITVTINASAAEEKRVQLAMVYQLARIKSYALLGLSVGWIGGVFDRWTSWPVLPLLSGVLLLMLGLYMLKFWNLLVYLEKAGWLIWRYIAPLQKRFFPIRYYSQALILGLLWGFLPCGLVYSALMLAATTGDATQGALSMFAFGLGTLPMMLAIGFFSRQLMNIFKKPTTQKLMGLIFFVWGIWQIYSAFNGHHHSH